MKSIVGLSQLFKKMNYNTIEEKITECFPHSNVKYYFRKVVCVLGGYEKYLPEGQSRKEVGKPLLQAIPMMLRREQCRALLSTLQMILNWETKL